MELRVTFTLAMVIIVFTACRFPVFAIFAAAGKLLVKLYGIRHMWVRSVALSNSAMNFLIYGSRMRNFSDAYTTIFRKAFGFVESHISSLKNLQCKKRLSGCCIPTSHSKQVFDICLWSNLRANHYIFIVSFFKFHSLSCYEYLQRNSKQWLAP